MAEINNESNHAVWTPIDGLPDEQGGNAKGFYFILVCLTLFAFVSRIGELVPFLGSLRINFVLLVLTLFMFIFSGVSSRIQWGECKEFKVVFYVFLLGCIGIPFSYWMKESFDTCKNIFSINLLLTMSCIAAVDSEAKLRGILKTIAASCCALVAGVYFKPVVYEGYRIATTSTYDVNDLAMIFAAFFPLVLYLFISSARKRKFLYVLLLAGMVYAIIKGASRGGSMALGITLILIFFSPRMGLRIIYKILMLGFVLIFLLSAHSTSLKERWMKVISGVDYNLTSTDSFASGRMVIWSSGIKLILKNPVNGVGAGSSSTAMGLEYGGGHAYKTMHNSYLQVTLELGLMGGLLFFIMLRRVWLNCSRSLKRYQQESPDTHLLLLARYLKISLITYSVAAFFLSQAYSIVLVMFLILSYNLIFILEKKNQVSQD